MLDAERSHELLNAVESALDAYAASLSSSLMDTPTHTQNTVLESIWTKDLGLAIRCLNRHCGRSLWTTPRQKEEEALASGPHRYQTIVQQQQPWKEMDSYKKRKPPSCSHNVSWSRRPPPASKYCKEALPCHVHTHCCLTHTHLTTHRAGGI